MNTVRFLSATALAGALFVLPSAALAQKSSTAPQSKGKVPQAATTEPADADAQVSRNADGSVATGDVIVVTGSRIARPEYSGVLPGVQVSGADLKARGFTNALEALNELPLVGNGASPLTGNNGGQAVSLGSAFVDLLDLGTARTLTLVNGRRYVSGNAASLFVAGNETGGQVDVNTIPAALIDRIDIVTVGGAAAYGSDAIAGVVNYVLKNKYEGVEVTGRAGMSARKDAGVYALSGIAGVNLLDNRLNLTVAAEYNHNDGLQADARDFRLRRATTITNYLNGANRNSAFTSAIINIAGVNNGAFLRASDDLVPSVAFAEGLINQTLSFNGTILNTVATPATSYTPLTQTVGGVLRTSNFITLDNGLGSVGNAIATPLGNISTSNTSFFNTATQLISGLPGATLISGNGRNGAATALLNLPLTTFSPTSLPAGVTAQNVFTQFNITPPAGASATDLSTLAINVLQANRPTAREFFALNPNVNTNYFLGTFIPGLPRIANTDTTLVTVAGVQVPVNQVLPFVAVPLEFNVDGSIRNYTAATLTPTTQGTIAQAPGSNGGFSAALANTVLRTQQDRFIANFNVNFEVSPNVTLFTENLYAKVRNVSLRNSPSQNFVTTGAENAALVLNVNNPFLTAANLASLNAVGINAATRGGSFALTRQNQDIFGNNPFVNTSDTYRVVGGARATFPLFGREFKAEASATYGRVVATTKTTQIKDIEYQLALDSARDSLGTIRCRAQLFPAQYLGRTPIATAANLTRLPGADGIPTESVFTPTITQAMIDQCQPLNPFGFDNMSAASKQYVRADVTFRNVSEQLFLQTSLTGSLFDLPAGPLGISIAGEYRRETLDFTSDSLNQLGRGRAAPSAQTTGKIRVFEGGGEARIPVFGPDFIPFLGSLEFNPAIRVSQQSGSSPTYRNLAGNLVSPTAVGKVSTIWSMAGSWRPIRDITLRGNITRSIRQPSIVELFLGGQPAFSAPADACGPAAIDSGSSAATRRVNCRAAVIAAGLGTNTSTADAFLASFVPVNAALAGSFSGSTGLLPERGNSYTFGGVLTPRFIPNLAISADFIHLDLSKVIQPIGLAQAVSFCYDSPTFPDSSAQTGSNTCASFTRQADFQVASGYASGFINLASTQIRAWKIEGRFDFDLPSNAGKIRLAGSAYNLMRYSDSASGNFSDVTESAGTFGRPKWKVNASARYEKGGFYSRLTWNWQNKTSLFTSGLPSTIENFPQVEIPAYSTFDVVVGADVTKKLRLQFVVSNITDKNYAGEIGLFTGSFVDQIGRRFQFSATSRF